MRAPEQFTPECTRDDRFLDVGDVPHLYALYHFLLRNFKSPDGLLSVSLTNRQQLAELLEGLGVRYNHIIGTDPKTGAQITVSLQQGEYFPTFGTGAFEACLVMKLKQVRRYHVPATLTDMHGKPSPFDGRYGIKRREFVGMLLRVRIPEVTMEDNEYEVVNIESIRNHCIRKDQQLRGICQMMPNPHHHRQNQLQARVFSAETFSRLADKEDKLLYLNIIWPDLSQQLREQCLHAGNIDILIDELYYVPFLMLTAGACVGRLPHCQSQEEHTENINSAVSDYCKALLVSTHDKALQRQACEGLLNLKDQLVNNNHCRIRLVRTLCEAINRLDIYDINILKDLLLNPFGLKELFSNTACHRPGPWRVEPIAPRFFMSILHKYESVTRVYSRDTADAYLGIMSVDIQSFEELKQSVRDGNVRETIKDLMAAIARNESPLPDYLANDLQFMARLEELNSLMPALQ